MQQQYKKIGSALSVLILVLTISMILPSTINASRSPTFASRPASISGAGSDRQTTPSLDRQRMDKLESDSRSTLSTIDMYSAITLALGSQKFQSLAAGHDLKFHSIFAIWKPVVDPAKPQELDSLNVVYYYETNSSSTNIVVTLDPTISNVVNVTTQENPLGDVLWNISWSGYELYRGPGQQTNQLYEATSSWTVPSANEPYSHACDGHHCDIMIWAGLAPTLGGRGSEGYIVQGGSDSGVYCAFGGCSQFYWAWYQFYPQPLQRCPAINSGDSITTDVINHAPDKANYWDINVFRNGNLYCSVTQNGFGVSTPYYAEFMAERPWNGWPDNYYSRLPNFSQFSMTADIDGKYPTHITGYTADQNGWSRNDVIHINGVDCISVSGAISPSSNFLETWQTSNGT